MSRRAKIKVTANLTSRRSESKSKIEISSAKNVFAQCDEILTVKAEKNDIEKQNNNESPIQEDKAKDVTTTIDEKSIKGADVKSSESSSKKKIENVNENVPEDEPVTKKIKSDTDLIISPIVSTLPDDENTFKTPSNVTRVEENATQSLSILGNTSLLQQQQQQQQQKSNKFRRQKIVPRLAATRTPKVEETEVFEKSPIDEISDVFDEQIIAKQQPETNFVDDWLVPPLSPSKQRFETIKEFHDPLLSPIIINSNLQPPPVPTSPFPHHPQHSRVRTESLCSMKSTMSAYNKDISGVMRKNFRTEENNRIIDTKRESKERLNNKNLDKNQLRMFDMIYYNPTTNPMKTKITPAKEKEVKKPLKLDVKLESPVVKIKEPETISNFLVPQLKLGPNGEMILDETSLVVENEQQKQNRILLANANVVYDDELSGTYGYYTRQKRTREWPADETVKFYRCLHTIGTDFSLMLNLFPNRTRRDLKLKFKKEEKSNGALINKALLHPNMFDIDELQRELDNDEKAKKKALETKSKAESNELLKKGIMKKHQAAKDKMKKKTKVERILSDGDLVLNLADNNLQQEAAKENVNIPMPEKKPRKCRKKAEPKGTEMSVVQEIIVDNPARVLASIEERFADLMPDTSEINFTIPAIEESYQISDESLITNDSNQLNFSTNSNNNNNNNTYFYDDMGNRIDCELMNEEDSPIVIDLPIDLPSVILNDSKEASSNDLESSTEMDQNYNCDASDDGSVRSFQTVFYNENGVNLDTIPMDIEMNQQDEIMNEPMEDPKKFDVNQQDNGDELIFVKQRYGHRRVLIDDDDEEEPHDVVKEAENINQEILIKQKYELHKIQIDDEEKPQEVVNDEKLVHEKILIEHEDDHKEILNVEKNDKQDIMLNQKILVDHEDDHKEIVNVEKNDQEIINNQKYELQRTQEEEHKGVVIEQEICQEILNQENVEHQEMVQELPKDQNLVTNNNDVIINVWKDVNNQILNIKDSNHYKDEVLTQPLINVADDHDILVEQYIENKEIVPTKLIYELPVQHSNAQRSDEEYYHSTNDPEVQQKITVDNVPCGTSAVQDDYEDLMKSLDFNSLVLAESQVDGKTVNEIYTMDSITEEISEKPLNLPQHVVDKIVSILNNADSDDEDA